MYIPQSTGVTSAIYFHVSNKITHERVKVTAGKTNKTGWTYHTTTTVYNAWTNRCQLRWASSSVDSTIVCAPYVTQKSNLVLDTQVSFHLLKQIAWDKLCMAPNSVLVEIVSFKNKQFKILLFPSVSLKDKVICLVNWTWILIKRVSARPSDLAFCYNCKGKFMIMSYPQGLCPGESLSETQFPVNRMTDRCKNNTLPQFLFACGNNNNNN